MVAAAIVAAAVATAIEFVVTPAFRLRGATVAGGFNPASRRITNGKLCGITESPEHDTSQTKDTPHLDNLGHHPDCSDCRSRGLSPLLSSLPFKLRHYRNDPRDAGATHKFPRR